MIRQPLNLAARLARRLPLTLPLIGQEARLELDGNVVFVTGAARGLGAEVAQQAYARRT